MVIGSIVSKSLWQLRSTTDAYPHRLSPLTRITVSAWQRRAFVTKEPLVPNDDTTKSAQRVWNADSTSSSFPLSSNWTNRVVDHDSALSFLDRIPPSSRMKTKQLGVLHEDPATDMMLLTQNYTLPAVASALRDREDALQQAAVLAETGQLGALQHFLRLFHPALVRERRKPAGGVNVTASLPDFSLERLRKTLMRMPRTVVSAHSKRAAVVIPLCTVSGVPSLLLEKRAQHLRNHPHEVCLPGGMHCAVEDPTIVSTCLREMREEIGGLEERDIQVLGVLRTNWGEVQHLVGVAVTPVVCYLGELPAQLHPNPTEVAEVFTIPLRSLVDQKLWVHREGFAAIFVGGPYPIYGLTGYILDRFAKDIIMPNSSRPDVDLSSFADPKYDT
jgi:nudix motif 8